MTNSQTPPSDTPPNRPHSLIDEIGNTRRAFMDLLQAHIELLRAELNEILAQVKVLATQAALALGMALITAILLYVGGALFLGEWLFGSIGWGLAHGVVLGIGVIVALVLAILGARARTSVASFIVAVFAVVVIVLLCGSNVAYDAANQTAGGLVQPLGTPGVVALLGGLVVGAILFTLLFARLGGRSGAVGGFFLGALLGALVGWLIAGAPWTWQPAAGFAILIGLILWPMVNLVLALPGLDPETRFKKLYPQQSIDAAQETREWLEEQWQTRLPRRSSK